MADTPTSELWSMRAAYIGLAILIVFVQLIPLQTTPRDWAPPDLIVAMTFAWALRRPEYVPSLAIAGVMLFADLMLHRPPGLMAALVLIAASSLKRQAMQVRDEGVMSEALLIVIAVVGTALLHRTILAILLVPNAPLGLTMVQVGMTILAYPFVVLISQLFFGVRARAPGDQATGGARL